MAVAGSREVPSPPIVETGGATFREMTQSAHRSEVNLLRRSVIMNCAGRCTYRFSRAESGIDHHQRKLAMHLNAGIMTMGRADRQYFCLVIPLDWNGRG